MFKAPGTRINEFWGLFYIGVYLLNVYSHFPCKKIVRLHRIFLLIHKKLQN